VEPLLLVGLDPPEATDIRRRVDRPVLAYETLPRIQVARGRLLVEHPNVMNAFVPVERVVYHAIFEDDFDFLTAMALWAGPCLPGACGMMDLRLRNPGLVRALAVTRFGGLSRSYADRGSTMDPGGESVAKWGNWHCGEDKTRFHGPWTAEVPTLIEDYVEGEAVRVVVIGERTWQVHMTGAGWLNSIHHPEAAFMPIDPELLDDARALAGHFGLAAAGIDYIVAPDGRRYLLEVNHVPNVTAFPEFREAFLEMVVAWAGIVGDPPAV
jgi:hypothetical protein